MTSRGVKQLTKGKGQMTNGAKPFRQHRNNTKNIYPPGVGEIKMKGVGLANKRDKENTGEKHRGRGGNVI